MSPSLPTTSPTAGPANKKSGAKKPASNSTKSTAKPGPSSAGPVTGKTSPATKKSEPAPVKREVVWPELKSILAIGKNALTAEKAKKLLGWQEESENIKFGHDYLLTNGAGKKVRCNHNLRNRWIDLAWVQTLKQEILNRRWQLNGEAIIVGQTGLMLSGQHQLVALILADEEWRKAEGTDKFADTWPMPPTMEKFLSAGISEDDKTVNTLDTARPRTFAHVIFRSEHFAKLPAKSRKQAARMTEHAVKLLWHRTGASDNAFAPRRTHAEGLDFIARHPRLLECVKHIMEEDGSDARIGRYLSLGYAAALCYLMGCAATVGETEAKDGYFDVADKGGAPTEAMLDWALWDRAQEFWLEVGQGTKTVAPIREALGIALEEGRGSLTLVKMALCVLAWNEYSQEKKITADCLELEYDVDGDGISHLKGTPVCGGIDIGGPVGKKEAEKD